MIKNSAIGLLLLWLVQYCQNLLKEGLIGAELFPMLIRVKTAKCQKMSTVKNVLYC
jgi:hypothetical protein